MGTIDLENDQRLARMFCEEFLRVGQRPRWILGTNFWADSIAKVADVDGFINDFAPGTSHRGKPVVRMEAVPKNALVVSAVVLGRPLYAAQKLTECGLENLDYFAFRRHANRDLAPVLFLDEFPAEYKRNRDEFEWVRGLLADEESVRIYDRLINFRLSTHLSHMEGFTDCQDRQYFEDFLGLTDREEVFVDVGGYDGFTTSEFVRRCPQYHAVHFFEPERKNIEHARQRLKDSHGITYYELGLMDRKGVVRFSSSGSASSVSSHGGIEIQVDRMDDVVAGPVTFIKMDVEGAEGAALAGARETISRQGPRLAIAAYHRVDDFFSIPRQILSYRDDYKVYLRHYTEGITESDMFFVPPQYARDS